MDQVNYPGFIEYLLTRLNSSRENIETNYCYYQQHLVGGGKEIVDNQMFCPC
tara:strand:+ start:465 stop:620 length:156 start_codon:yes stop_codon:yes gene_type:complete